MTNEKDTRSFNRRLMDAMEEMENPTKSKTANVPTKSGKSYQYKYETLDQVLAVVRPALMNNGLALTQMQKYDAIIGEWVLETIVFSDKDHKIVDMRLMPQMADAQQAGSWETYMRRYALRTAFGLTGEDDDGAATKQSFKAPKKATPEQYETLNLLSEKMAEATGKDVHEVQDALLNSNSVKSSGATAWESMTQSQANIAECQLRAWLDKIETQKLSDEDIEF